jgi:type II secretory pathway pseudopilin PulG
MGSKRSEGYTIIEVSLFLGISALLLAVALAGTGLSIRTARFTDSTRLLHAYVQQQYDDLLNGVNSRFGTEACNSGTVSTGTPQTPGTSNCLYMGRLMVLAQGSSDIMTYSIVGTEPANPDYSKSDEQLIYDFTPTIIRNVGVQTYNIPWLATVSGSKRPIDGKAVDAFALVRSPRSTRIVSYTYKELSSSYALAPLINPGVASNANNISKPASFCISSADGIGQPSKIIVSGGQGQDAIGVLFDTVVGDCNGT